MDEMTFRLGELDVDAIDYGSAGNAILGIRDSGKALALDTPIPTPTGWSTMGSLREGDAVFDEEGRACTVLYTAPVQYDRPCYRVEFSDGSSVVADGEHLWLTETYASRVATRNAAIKGSLGQGRGDRPQCQRKSFPAIVTTEEIRDTLIAGGRVYKERNHSIRHAGALRLAEADLPIDPYVLGCWLGDGTSVCAVVTTADDEVLEHIGAKGYSIGKRHAVSPSGRSAGYRIQTGPDGEKLHTRLREMGLLGNKHVPAMYLRASVEQRKALLSGLMDTDGTVQRGSNSCVFYNTSRLLADAAYELVCSLGWAATYRSKRAMLNGVDFGECFEVRFRPTHQIFRLSRKADMLDLSVRQGQRRTKRMIVAVEPVQSVPVRCIRVS